jgi:hypothetical protein
MRSERNSPPWTKTLEELRSLSDAELETQHDAMVLEHGPTAASLNYYLDELARTLRRADRGHTVASQTQTGAATW